MKIILVTVFCILHTSNSLVIETLNGKVEGAQKKTLSQGKDINYFLGIPFAEPPVTEELRFENPKPKGNWSGILNCTQYKDMCVQAQPPITGSEDCLYINIFTPINPLENPKKLPVLLWIHGGGFIGGNGYMNLTMPDSYLDKDIVVVTIQYRLGILGFLSSGDGVIPENLGLRDQILALEWTSKNIKYFGGDEKNLTIFGESAGAASVSFLIQAKQTKGLFQKAIMDSGNSLCLWSLSRKSAKITKAVAALMGINIFNSKSLLAGLKKANLQRMIELSWNAQLTEILLTNIQEGLVFAPMIESNSSDPVIPSGSYDILDKGQFNKVPILIGINSLEANEDITFFIRLYILQYDAVPLKLVPRDMNAAWYNLLPAGDKIKQFYFGNTPIALSNTQILRQISDDLFNRATLETVKLYSKHEKAYLYWFNYEGQLKGNVNRSAPGVGHAEELQYVWDVPTNGSSQDNLVVNRTQTLWANFVKFGNPTPETNDQLLENVTWPPAYEIGKVDEKVKYLNISKDLRAGEDLQGDTMRFWRKLYKDYGRPPFNTF